MNIELSQTQLDVVVRAFDGLLSNPDVIDFNMASFSPLPYLEGLNDKLKTFQNREEAVQITLDFEDWTTFFPYLELARSNVFDIEDAEILDELYERYLLKE